MSTNKHFLLLAFLLGATTIKAQTTFAPIGAKWTYLEQFAFIGDSAIVEIESIADTVMLGHTCQVLEYTGITTCTPTYRYVRTSNDTVYFWEPVSGSFQILYVADATTGESWNTMVSSISWEMYGATTATVTSTATVTIGGLPLRRLVRTYTSAPGFSINTGAYVTERLGDARYLFPWMLSNCDGDYVMALRCYEDPDISWVNPQFMQCELSTGLHEHSSTAFPLLPSIVRVGERIPITSNGGSAMRAEAFDASGRTLLDRTFQGTMDLVFSTSGLHLVRLTSDRSRPIVKRVVVN